jgi:hypothetical protein
MCLIIHQPKKLNLSEQLLTDIYNRNSDGLGIMYAEKGKLRVHRSLPKSAAEFIAAYEAHGAGREIVLHARMTTHGDTDLDNCHPFAVTPRVALAHNGILSFGNEWDKTKSDTWHFVQRVITPAVAYDEALIHDAAWQKYIGAVIGSSNKFAMMDRHGQVSIINRDSGVEFLGAWWSNTYAWPAAAYGCKSNYSGYRDWDYGSYGNYSRYSGGRWDAHMGKWVYDEDEADAEGDKAQPSDSTATVVLTPTPTPKVKVKVKAKNGSMLPIFRAARNCYVRGQTLRWVHDAPDKAERFLSAVAGEMLWSQTRRDHTVAAVRTDPPTAAQAIEDWFDNGYDCPDEHDTAAAWWKAAAQEAAEEDAARAEAAEQEAAEQEAAEQEAAEQEAAEQEAAEQEAAEQQPAEQQPAEQQPAEQQPAEQPAEQEAAEQQPAEQEAAEQQPAEQQPAEQQPAEQQPAEQPLDLGFLERAHRFAENLEMDAYLAAELVDELRAMTRDTLDSSAIQEAQRRAVDLADGIARSHGMVARLQASRLLSVGGTIAALEGAADEADQPAQDLLDILDALSGTAAYPKSAATGTALSRAH